MPHIVILARSEPGTSDETIFWPYDFACEEGSQIWMGVGQMLD
jgi:hypothetical protein